MVPICYCCLRTDRKLLILSEEIEFFFDQMCEFESGDKIRFCVECAAKVKKCYKFRSSCILAQRTLKKWQTNRNRSTRKPIELLYKELPRKSHLGLSNRKNFQVYSYEAGALKRKSTQKSSENPHVITLNISEEDSSNECETQDVAIESQDIVTIAQEVLNNDFVKQEVVELPEMPKEEDSIKVKNEMEFLNEDSEDNNDDVTNDADFKLEDGDSDSSLDYLLSQHKVKKEEVKVKKRRRRLDPDDPDRVKRKKVKPEPVDLNDLKDKLRKKFDEGGVMKDEAGPLIDIELVIKNLDKFSDKTHKIVRKICLGPGPFSPLAISKLSEIQGTAKFEKMFTITRLKTPEEIKAEYEKRRHYPNYLKHQYRCESCLTGFRHQNLLEEHMRKFHETPTAFQCDLCKKYFNRRRTCTTHYSKAHMCICKCNLCDFVATNAFAMSAHFEKHNGKRYECDQCSSKFKARSAYYQHLNTHDPRFICDLCACAFSSPNGLTIHKRFKHVGETFVKSDENRKCDACEIVFLNESVFDKHLKLKHKIESDETIARPIRRRQHPVQRGKRTYQCRLCDWKSSSMYERTQHYSSQHPNAEITDENWKFLCPQCGKRFKYHFAYKDHMNKHNNVRPYVCSKCPKAFFSATVLDSHMSRHFPPSKECQYCGKMFATTSGLSSHMRIHINDRRFKCEICEKGFLHAAALREHVNGVHYNIRRVKKPRRRNDCRLEAPYT